MKKRITILSLAIVALGALAVAPLMFGGPGGRFGGHGFGAGHRGMGPHGGGFAEGFVVGRLAHLADDLDLSDAQREQIKTIMVDLRAQNEPYREQLRGGMHEVATLLIENPANVGAAQAKLDAQTAAENAMKKNVLVASSKALSVLTPQQREELGELLEQHAAKMQKRFGR